MALDKKHAALERLQPDIAIVSECANGEILKRKAPEFSPSSQTWIGDNPNKGLGVFTFGSYVGDLSPIHDSNIPFIAPILIKGSTSFNLLAVWACHAKPNSYAASLGPLRRAIETYKNFIRSSKTVVAGDFNDNTQWDKPKKENSHLKNVALLAELGLRSAYHCTRPAEQGKEPDPTIYWRDRKRDGPSYHIDYCFVPDSWEKSIKSVTIGTFSDWVETKISDHVPLIVDLEISQALV